MTKLEICAVEDANPGQVNLYPEGSFYKAYQQSAWLLCTRVHPFKVSAPPIGGDIAKNIRSAVARVAKGQLNAQEKASVERSKKIREQELYVDIKKEK